MRDIHASLSVSTALDPAARTADADGDTIDLQGFDACEFAIVVGASASTISDANKIEFELEHADDDGSGSPDSWEDVPDAQVLRPVAGATSTGTIVVLDDPAQLEATYQGGYIGGRRFVRIVANHSGTHASTGTVYGAVAVKGYASLTPNG